MGHENSPLSAGTQVRAVDFPPTATSMSDTVITNITATTYTTGAPEVGARFQAPTSGRVAITVSAGVRVDSATTPADRLFIAPQVLHGDPNDGNVILAEEVKNGVSTPGTPDATDDYAFGGKMTLLGGLVPGDFYYARVRYRTTLGNGTADLNYRSISVVPIP